MKIEQNKVNTVLEEFGREDLFLKKFDKEAAESMNIKLEDVAELMYRVRLAGQILLEHELFSTFVEREEFINPLSQVLIEVFNINLSNHEIEEIQDIILKQYYLEIENF